MKEIFIPLLRDETTWDREKKIILLDEHFLAGKSKDLFKNLDYEIIDDVPKLEYEDILRIAHEISECLSKVLNDLHNTNYPSWYWYGVMVQWLKHIVFSIYDKCMRIEMILNRYKGYNVKFQHISCPERIPNSFEEFYGDEISSDYHYVYVYNKLLESYNCILDNDVIDNAALTQYEFNPFQPISRVSRFVNTCLGGKDAINRLIKQIRCKITMSMVSVEPEVALCSVGFPPDIVDYLVKKSRGKIQPVNLIPHFPSEHTVNVRVRNMIREELHCQFNEVNHMWIKKMCDIIPLLIPHCYLEDYEFLLKQIPRIFQDGTVRTIVSVGYYTTFIRLTALTSKVKTGARLLATQHGGNYGVIKYVDYYDYIWDDVFYTWGPWKSDDDYIHKMLKWAPSVKFIYYNTVKIDKKCEGILFVGTAVFIHDDVDHIYLDSESRMEYISRQIKIFDILSDSLLSEITVRNYYIEYGWDINNILKKFFPTLRIDDNFHRNDFFKELQKCRLLLVDHLSTTWIEALFINKPFIIVMNVKSYRFTTSSMKFVEKMLKVGIIRDVDTLGELPEIYEDIESWWNNPERQTVIKMIRDNYCYNQSMSVDEMATWWLSELSCAKE